MTFMKFLEIEHKDISTISDHEKFGLYFDYINISGRIFNMPTSIKFQTALKYYEKRIKEDLKSWG
jgi:hypothetical protein